jgi:periplasmic protein TonB
MQLPPRDNQPDPVEVRKERPRYRPPIGIPIKKQRRAGSFLLAVLLHVLVIFLLVVPFTSPELMSEVLGAGGAGPAGGGGGGNRGTGGQRERLEFVNVAPAPAPTPPPPVVRPPVVPPLVPPPPPPPKVEQPKPQTPTPSQSTNQQTAQASAPVAGTGGGTGNDGTSGTGPGSGGGTGTGVGTGTGSATGPGTGGGTGSVFPPTPIEVIIPPMPAPARASGEVVVEFDVDSTGKVLDFVFQPTRDGNYNKRLQETLRATKFRPGVSATGVPMRAKYQMVLTISGR